MENLAILGIGICLFIGYLALLGGIAEYRRERTFRRRYDKIRNADLK